MCHFLIPFSQTKIIYFIYLRKREDVTFVNTRIYSIIFFLHRRGQRDEEIETLFAKYDIDGDRVLNHFEQQEMLAELRNQVVIFCALSVWHVSFIVTFHTVGLFDSRTLQKFIIVTYRFFCNKLHYKISDFLKGAYLLGRLFKINIMEHAEFKK